jgi:hypothetical protein
MPTQIGTLPKSRIRLYDLRSVVSLVPAPVGAGLFRLAHVLVVALEGTSTSACPPLTFSGAAPTEASRRLQRAKEIQEVLFLCLIELVEVIDDRVRLRRSERRVPRALVRLDRHQQIRRPPVMQEEDPLTKTPQGRGPEFVALGPCTCPSLVDTLAKSPMVPLAAVSRTPAD